MAAETKAALRSGVEHAVDLMNRRHYLLRQRLNNIRCQVVPEDLATQHSRHDLSEVFVGGRRYPDRQDTIGSAVRSMV